MTGLAGKVELLHQGLDEGGIPHAFGGAIALAYCTSEPRATADIDVNVFVHPRQTREVFDALPDGVTTTGADVEAARERGQVRLWWGDTPLDVFFAYHAFHEAAAERSRSVPFAQIEIPVLDCSDLVVFKAVYGRPRDWVDIQAAADAGLDLAEAVARLRMIVGAEDAAVQRLDTLSRSDTEGAEAYRRVFGSPGDA